MSNIARLSLAQYDLMVEQGVFDRNRRRLEFIRGEIREMSSWCVQLRTLSG